MTEVFWVKRAQSQNHWAEMLVFGVYEPKEIDKNKNFSKFQPASDISGAANCAIIYGSVYNTRSCVQMASRTII